MFARLRRFAMTLCFGSALGLASCGNGDPNRIELFEPDDPEAMCQPDVVCVSPTPYCYGSLCVACLTDTNCGNKFCEPSSRTCVECVTSGDCKNDKPYCLANQCRQCLVPEHCADPMATCDTREGKCVPACARNEDCSGPNPVCLLDLGLCAACAVDDDCPDDRAHCEANKCVACRGAEDCDMARPFCDPEKLECVECLEDGDCGAERSCDMRKCM